MQKGSKKYHRLLERQLRKAFGRNAIIPAEWEGLLRMVSESYNHGDEDREMLERSLDLSSKELLEVNRSLMRQQQELEETLERLRNTEEELVVSQRMAALSQQLKEANATLLQQTTELERAYEDIQTAQSQLVHAEKMSSLGQLTAGVAHEINNPVNFIYAGIQALRLTAAELFKLIETHHAQMEQAASINATERDKYKQEILELKEDLWEMIDSVQVGAERTTTIVQGLRNFARTDTEEFQFCLLPDLLESTLVVLGSQIDEHISIVKDFDSSLGEVPCLPGQLNQVFMNILSNAIQAMDYKGNITIEVKHQDADFAMVRIADTGPGMDEATQAKIFDPFYTTKEIGKGTGLGLSISYGIIEKHGGRIWVESKKGEGAAFCIALPKYLVPNNEA